MTPRRFALQLAALALLPVSPTLAQQSGGVRRYASFTEQFASGPCPSPDGRFLVLGTRTELRLYDVMSRRTTKLVDGQGWEIAWSPKGDRIAWVRGGEEGAGEYVWTMGLDSKTGKPSGPPQRVSLGQGEFPSVSLDGRWIAFSAPDSEGPGSTSGLRPHHIAAVPVTGGPERALAHFKRGIEPIIWSADGKSIFTSGMTPTGELGVVKVPVDGRPMQVLHKGAEFMVGMTANRERIVLVPAKGTVAPGDRAIIIDTTGKEVSRIPLPVGKLMSFEGVIGDTSLVWIDLDNRQRIEIRSSAGASPKRIAGGGQSNELPAWSPDGKHLAFQVRTDDRRGIAMADADGGNLRMLGEPSSDPDATPGAMRWSPDSKYVGFTNADHHQFTVIDVATRRARNVVRDTTVRINAWTWSDDARSVVAVMVKSLSPSRGTIDEIRLSGARRSLFDFGTLGLQANSGFAGFTFLGDSAVAYRADSAAYVLNLRSTGPRQLAPIPRATLVVPTVASGDHEWIAGPLKDMKHRDGDQLEVLSTETGERRVLDVPFRFAGAGWPAFLPDNRAILILGRRDTDTTTASLYSVPVNGDPPRALATLGRLPGNAPMTISPDGKSIAYPVLESHTLNLLLVDLRAR